MKTATVGVLALQGAFLEHVNLLKIAGRELEIEDARTGLSIAVIEVRRQDDLKQCDALIIPGGESTTVSLVAARSDLLEPLRQFVKIQQKPTWGTCAGLIMLAEEANRTKQGGQDLIGGLNVRVNRNYFGRQTESFETPLALSFIENAAAPFNGVFIRAPVVEAILPGHRSSLSADMKDNGTMHNDGIVHAPCVGAMSTAPVKVMATLPGRSQSLRRRMEGLGLQDDIGDIIAVQQGHIFGTSFHPELTTDIRIHKWWLSQVVATFRTQAVREDR